jgi:hypothetical protein
MRVLMVSAMVGVALSSCEAPTSEKTSSRVDRLWNESAHRPHMLAGDLFHSELDGEGAARAFLLSRAAEFHLAGKGLTLSLGATRVGLGGTYYRFQQQQSLGAETVPVFGAEVVVLVRKEGDEQVVRAVNLEHQERVESVTVGADIGQAAALSRAMALAGSGPASAEPTATKGIWVSDSKVPFVAWKIRVPMEEASPPHDWSFFIDAATGEELARLDGIRYQAVATGTGLVFDMNPVASTGDLTLADNGDATNPALDGARFSVPLPRLDGTGALRGMYVDVLTRNAPRVVSMTNEFRFSRNELGFEQANVYFHIDRIQSRIQALGFLAVNNRVQTATVNAQADDNSYYSGGNRQLFFGTGGVDDAEDGDIVAHEYGHSIQDNQVPGFGGGDEGAMGEGFGDYLAASFGATLPVASGRMQAADPACVGDWDAQAYSPTQPRCLRRVDGTGHYPEDAVGQVHADGEIWSAALWNLRSKLGADVTDRLVFESHFLLGTSASFFTASQALLSADLTLNAGVHQATIRRTLIAFGLSRALSSPASMGPTTRVMLSRSPTRNAGRYLPNADDVRTVVVPGASGILVHFSRIDLETGRNSCLQRNCDNLYLTNSEGDLFQVLGGNQQDILSVAVPGDTVNIRLVSNGAREFSGYEVDYVEAIGAVDGGFVLDAGTGERDDAGLPFDAGMRDAGLLRDAGFTVDAGRVDAGTIDAGRPGPFDAGYDAGQTVPSPGPVTDGGVRSTDVVVKRTAVPAELGPGVGCGCSTGAGFDAVALLAAWAVWSRRRRSAA